MRVKIALARALKVARANGYDGGDDLASVKTWFEANCQTPTGEQFEVVPALKVKTVTVKADAGEDVVIAEPDEAPPEDALTAPDAEAKAAEVAELRRKAAELDAIKGIARVTGANARIAGGTGLTAKSHHRISARKSYDQKAAQGKTVWTDAEESEAFGAAIRLRVFGWRDYAEKAYDEEIVRKTGLTNQFTSTGALVLEQFTGRFINLQLQYGVFSKLAASQKMSSDVASIIRQTGDLTVYSPGEGGAGTASNNTFDRPQLVARKRLTLTHLSHESMNDAAVNLGDITAKAIAQAFAKDDDNRGFNGDGTSTYAGDVGMRPYIKALSGTISYIAGLYVGTGNLYSELVLNDFLNTEALLPEFEGASGAPKWCVSPRFYHGVMRPLAAAGGGTTYADIINGVPQLRFDGYEVVLSEQMPRVTGNSQVCALFGHFDMAATHGTVGQIAIDTSTDFDFDNDVITIRGRNRSAITVHDMGNADATEANRVVGPVVGLITAAS